MKSRTTSAVLTVLFGPLGLFYTTTIGAIVMIVAAIATAATIVGPLLVWVGAVFWGDYLVRQSRLRGAQQPSAVAGTSDENAQEVVPTVVSAQQTKPKQSPRILGVSVWELLLYAVLVIFLIFVLPDLLGRENPRQSALSFYVELLGWE